MGSVTIRSQSKMALSNEAGEELPNADEVVLSSDLNAVCRPKEINGKIRAYCERRDKQQENPVT